MSSIDPFNYIRRKADSVQIGSLLMGGDAPVRVQSMANTDTNDIESSAAQCIRIIEAGGELVRFTAQGVREAENLRLIHEAVRQQGFNTPLVADIHFMPAAADVAAQYVEKVRINPGNYIRSVKAAGDLSDYTEEEFFREYELIYTRFAQFLNICKQHGTSIRIGVNHGSLSERVMNRYGDTPRGMVESAMEFLRICRDNEFDQVVISMKTSNTVLMVHAVRLLIDAMDEEDMHYPLHLGVTEAGDGEDGRIKSAVGIGALLVDGIGDTIRVSLSEAPEAEIPVARSLTAYIKSRENHVPIQAAVYEAASWLTFLRRKTYTAVNIGGASFPVVIAPKKGNYALEPDYVLSNGFVINQQGEQFSVFTVRDLDIMKKDPGKLKFLKLFFEELDRKVLDFLQERKDVVILLASENSNPVGDRRAFMHTIMHASCDTPVVFHAQYRESELEQLQLKAAADLGVLFIDGLGDGLLIENVGEIASEDVNSICFGILQAARVRVSKTEYISCPSCGRTLFDIQKVIARVKKRTSHLKGLKIGIMGCIVNGPGEMADADYGYVGAGRGKVSLYKKQECVERNIPEEDAVERLVQLIKLHGDWYDI